MGTDFSSTSLHFYKLTFSNTLADWSNKIIWVDYCPTSASESLLNNDNSKIYSFPNYQIIQSYAYFITFSISNGSVLGSRYRSNISCSGIYGSVLSDSYVVVTALCQNAYLILFNTISSAFTIRMFSGTKLYSVGLDAYSGR